MGRLFGQHTADRRSRHDGERPPRRVLLPFFTIVFLLGLVGGLILASWLIDAGDIARMRNAPRPVPAAENAVAAAPRPVPPAHRRTGRVRPQPVPERPAWHDHGVATQARLERPAVAVVIDDLGEQRRRSRAMADLPGPLTLSYFPHTRALDRLVSDAKRSGHEIMLHMPMASAKDINPGPKPLTGALDPASNQRRLAQALAAFPAPDPVAVNNHMGSAFTANAHQMRRMLSFLGRRGVLYLDSLTADGSQARRLASATGADVIARDVFLDHERSPAAIRRALARTARIAQKHGTAIAIGHPYPETRRALAEWLPAARERGLAIVSLSRVARVRLAGRQEELARDEAREARLSDG